MLAGPTARTISLRQAVKSLAAIGFVVQVASFGSSIAVATILGASTETDAYYLALGIPVLAYGVVLAGIRLGAVPALTKRESEVSEFNRAASELSGVVAAGGVALTIAVALGAWLLLPLLAGDASSEVVDISRVTLLIVAPVCLLGSLTGALGAILTVRGLYLLPVLVGVFDPLAKAALLVAFDGDLGAVGLALGNLVGGVLSIGCLWRWARRNGILIVPRWKPRSAFMGGVYAVGVPLLLAEVVLQINPITDRLLTAPLGPGSVTELELGFRLFSVPVVLLGSTLIAPVVAAWSARLRDEGEEALNRSTLTALRAVLKFTPPLAVAGFATSAGIVAFIYGAGQFTADSATTTADVLRYFMVGLPAQILVVVVASFFIVREDVVIPAAIACANVVLNLLTSLVLREWLGVAGVALGSTATVVTLVLVYLVVASHRHSLRVWSGTRDVVVAAFFATALTAAVALVSHAEAFPEPSTRLEDGLYATAGVLGLICVYALGFAITTRALRRWPGGFAPS